MTQFIARQNKTLLIVVAGIVMIGGDYLVSYFDSQLVFLAGEVLSLIGWAVFVIAFDK